MRFVWLTEVLPRYGHHHRPRHSELYGHRRRTLSTKANRRPVEGGGPFLFRAGVAQPAKVPPTVVFEVFHVLGDADLVVLVLVVDAGEAVALAQEVPAVEAVLVHGVKAVEAGEALDDRIKRFSTKKGRSGQNACARHFLPTVPHIFLKLLDSFP